MSEITKYMREISEIMVGGKSLQEILDGVKPYDLSGADLSGADLSGADLDLSGTNLRRANLSRADLSGADLSGTNLRRANLSRANLSRADLSWANLSRANLSRANLSRADLSWANLSRANLSRANLSRADLSWANLSWANLSWVNLSGATGLLVASEWIAQNFKQDELGLIVYKRIGKGNTEYPPCKNWVIEHGSYISEIVNRVPTDLCGCGVNFGTLDWCEKNYMDAVLWKCRIRWVDLADVVVPYNTDGKARCGKLELLEIVPEVK